MFEKTQQLITRQEVVVRDYKGLICLLEDSCFLVYNTQGKEN